VLYVQRVRAVWERTTLPHATDMFFFVGDCSFSMSLLTRAKSRLFPVTTMLWRRCVRGLAAACCSKSSNFNIHVCLMYDFGVALASQEIFTAPTSRAGTGARGPRGPPEMMGMEYPGMDGGHSHMHDMGGDWMDSDPHGGPGFDPRMMMGMPGGDGGPEAAMLNQEMLLEMFGGDEEAAVEYLMSQMGMAQSMGGMPGIPGMPPGVPPGMPGMPGMFGMMESGMVSGLCDPGRA